MTAPDRIPIAVFLTSFDCGGTERQMTELVCRLNPRQFDVRVATFHRRGPYLARVEPVASEIAEFPVSGFGSPGALVQLLRFSRWCRSRRIAVLQAADIYANAFALAGAALARVPVRVGSRREVHPSRGRALEGLQRLGYRMAHTIVANSDSGARRLSREGIARERIAVVRNGLDLSGFSLRSSPPRRHRIVSVARLRPEKAHEVLIDAVARVRPSWPQVSLRVIGDGPREQALREAAGQLGVLDRVEFAGHSDDVAGELRRADVFVLPSRIEASPNAILEAMAVGLPVIACAVGGIPEAIVDGKTGLLVPPDDAGAMAGAIDRIFRNPAEAEQIGLAARRHVEAHYSFARMVAAFENIYRRELTRRGYRHAALNADPRGLQAAVS